MPQDPTQTYLDRRPSIMPRFFHIGAGLTPKDCRAILAGISRPSAEVDAQAICDQLNDEVEQSIAIIQEIVDGNGTRAKVLTAADLAGEDFDASQAVKDVYPEYFTEGKE